MPMTLSTDIFLPTAKAGGFQFDKHFMRSRVMVLAVACAALMWNWACAPAPSNATLSVAVEPAEVEAGGEVTLKITVTDFTLNKDELGKANQPGMGHYRVYLDEQEGANFLAEDATASVKVTIPKDAKPGEHKLRVELRQNDKSELTPKVAKTVTFKVKTGKVTPPTKKPELSAKAKESKVASGGQAVLDISVKNFQLVDPKTNISNEDGKGHYLVYLDDAKGDKHIYKGFEALAKVDIDASVTNGKHKLRVVLVNNNETPLDPNVEATVDIEVVTGGPSVTVTPDKKDLNAGDLLTLTIKAENFKLSKEGMGKANKAGEGHYRIYFDDKTGKDFYKADAVEFFLFTVDPKWKSGKHIIRVVLVQNDGNPLKPNAETKVEINVKSAKVPKISALPDRTTVKPGGAIRVTILIENFTLTNYGSKPPNKFGYGHYRIYFDDLKQYLKRGFGTGNTIIVPKAAKPGKHKIIFMLASNDSKNLNTKPDFSFDIVVNATGIPVCTPAFKTNLGSQCGTVEDRTGATSDRSINFPGRSYSPACMRIKVGQTVSFQGTFSSHPLDPACGNYEVIVPTRSGVQKEFTFTKPGTYGYYCIRHGSRDGKGMAGLIYVVDGTAPSVTATVKPGTVALGGKLTLTVKTSNFKLTPISSNPKNVKGQGHYHVYLNGATGKNYWKASHLGTLSLVVPKNLKAGVNTLRVQLMNNNHTPLAPTTQTTVRFTVSGGSSGGAKPCNSTILTNLGCKTYTTKTKATDSRVITFSGRVYTPKCLRIMRGQSVEFKGSFSGHPLRGICGVDSTISFTSSVTTGSSKKYTFTKPGIYVYYCTRHASAQGTGMVGLIQVLRPQPVLTVTPDKTTLKAGTAIKLTIKATEFAMVAFQPKVPNKNRNGHYKVYLDASKTPIKEDYRGVTTITLPKTTKAGKHTLKVQLVNNDGTPYNPVREKTISITIQ